MKKRFLFPILLLLCLFGSTAYAASVGDEKAETITLTEENRYDPVYYREPEELYPTANSETSPSTDLSLEEYVVAALENLETEINVSAYEIPVEEAETRYFQILTRSGQGPCLGR